MFVSDTLASCTALSAAIVCAAQSVWVSKETVASWAPLQQCDQTLQHVLHKLVSTSSHRRRPLVCNTVMINRRLLHARHFIIQDFGIHNSSSMPGNCALRLSKHVNAAMHRYASERLLHATISQPSEDRVRCTAESICSSTRLTKGSIRSA